MYDVRRMRDESEFLPVWNRFKNHLTKINWESEDGKTCYLTFNTGGQELHITYNVWCTSLSAEFITNVDNIRFDWNHQRDHNGQNSSVEMCRVFDELLKIARHGISDNAVNYLRELEDKSVKKSPEKVVNKTAELFTVESVVDRIAKKFLNKVTNKAADSVIKKLK